MPPKACSSLEAPPFGLPLKNVRMFAVYMTLSSICPSRSHLTKEGGQVAMVAHCHRQLARRKLHAQQEGGYAPSQTPRSHCNHPLLCSCFGQEKGNSSGGCPPRQDGPRDRRSNRRRRCQRPERQSCRPCRCGESPGSVGTVYARAGRIYS